MKIRLLHFFLVVCLAFGASLAQAQHNGNNGNGNGNNGNGNGNNGNGNGNNGNGNGNQTPAYALESGLECKLLPFSERGQALNSRYVRLLCRLKDKDASQISAPASGVSFTTSKLSLAGCASSNSCSQSLLGSSDAANTSFSLSTTSWSEVATWEVSNTKDSDNAISANVLAVSVSRDSSGNISGVDLKISARDYKVEQSVVLAAKPKDDNPSCLIAVSGKADGDSTGTKDGDYCQTKDCKPSGDAPYVANAKTQLDIVLSGVPVGDVSKSSVKWNVNGDIAQSASYEFDPQPETSYIARAEVETPNGSKLYCATHFQSQGKGYSIKFERAGDCATFTQARNYYLGVDTDKDSVYSKIAGSNRMFKGEVPFKGVADGFRTKEGTLVIGKDGKPEQPVGFNRKYHSRILLQAYLFNPSATESKNEPVLWGWIDPKTFDSKATNIYKTPAFEKYGLNDDDDADTNMVTFRATLLTLEVPEKTGSGWLEVFNRYYKYINSFSDKFAPIDLAKDYVIPFAYGSCSATFDFRPPKLQGTDKEFPAELESVGLCQASKAFRLADVLRGRLPFMSLWFMSPGNIEESYPANLLTARLDEETCSSDYYEGDSAAKRDCWVLDRSQLPKTIENPDDSHSDCVKVTTTWVYSYCDNGQYSDIDDCYYQQYCRGCSSGGSCDSRCVKKTKTEYKAGCAVTEVKNECTRGLAMRFSGYTQMMFAALGCAYQFNEPNKSVTATLNKQGILPYMADSTLGGSEPKTQYASSLWGAWSSEQKVAGCVPCRFEGGSGKNLESTTIAIPLDPDSSHSGKLPIFSFAKKTGQPAKCVKDTKVEVRYFGSDACDGQTDKEGHFCSSGNIPPRTCSAKGLSSPNNAMEFTIPLCAGSDLGYGSVSASLSPLVLDIMGNGISVSRSKADAVLFDMKGTGKKILVDWPINNSEVAFLVKPDIHGEVNSIKQLFGDYKAKNGFESLRKYDSDKNGVFDSHDKMYGKLRLWFDYNRDGVCDKDYELATLTEFGIDSIRLDYSHIMGEDVAKKELVASYFSRVLQAHKNIKDVYFYVYSKEEKKK